jgi:hypothetical protein
MANAAASLGSHAETETEEKIGMNEREREREAEADWKMREREEEVTCQIAAKNERRKPHPLYTQLCRPGRNKKQFRGTSNSLLNLMKTLFFST